MRVLFVASECAPYRRTGGLGEVVGALPRALRRLGADVRVVTPLYAGFPWLQLERLDGVLSVPGPDGWQHAAVRMSGRDAEVPVYFVEHRGYFDRPHLYGPPGAAYEDNLERFAFFCRAAIELAKAVAFDADVVHAHDWQSALVPAYLRLPGTAGTLQRSATVFTVHNLAHQGVFGLDQWRRLGLPEAARADIEHFGALNLMKGALVGSTRVTTVSPTYALEIATPQHGMGLDGVLRARGADFRGILNGIDTEEWNPSADPHLAARFDAGDRSGKRRCKAALQAEAGFAERPAIPLFGVVSRLVDQKGIDVLAAAAERLLSLDLQLVVLGTGDPAIEQRLAVIADRYRDRFRLWLGFDEARAHRIEAGADFFLMPSRFEPCGLNQLYSLRYGTLPVVRATGGLVDTVDSYDAAHDTGVGFVLHDLDPGSLFDTVAWAAATWREHPDAIARMQERAMVRDHSWLRSAERYLELYSELGG